MKRGEIRWYSFQPPDKRRPVFILTRDSIIPFLNEIVVAPVTSSIRDIPSEVLLDVEDGMPQTCVINFDHLYTVSKGKIGKLITTLSVEKLNQVAQAISFALGLDVFLPPAKTK
jgi:mRNA interferase MazF